MEDAGVQVHLDNFREMGYASFTIWAQGLGTHNQPDLKARILHAIAILLGEELKQTI